MHILNVYYEWTREGEGEGAEGVSEGDRHRGLTMYIKNGCIK